MEEWNRRGRRAARCANESNPGHVRETPVTKARTESFFKRVKGWRRRRWGTFRWNERPAHSRRAGEGAGAGGTRTGGGGGSAGCRSWRSGGAKPVPGIRNAQNRRRVSLSRVTCTRLAGHTSAPRKHASASTAQSDHARQLTAPRTLGHASIPSGKGLKVEVQQWDGAVREVDRAARDLSSIVPPEEAGADNAALLSFTRLVAVDLVKLKRDALARDVQAGRQLLTSAGVRAIPVCRDSSSRA